MCGLQGLQSAGAPPVFKLTLKMMELTPGMVVVRQGFPAHGLTRVAWLR